MTSSIQADIAGAAPKRDAASFLTFRNLGVDTLAYGIGGAIAKMLGFLLVLVYTRVFTPAVYGSLEMLNVLGMMVAMFVVLGLDTAQTVFVSQRAGDEAARRDIVSATLQWRVVWGLFVVGLLLLAAPLINRFAFSNTLRVGDFAWAFLAAYFTTFITQMTDLARVLRRRTAYLLITLAQAVVTSAFVLAVILLFRGGLRGYLEALCLATALVAVFALWSFREYIVPRVQSRELYRALVRFGIPLVPGGLAMYVLFSSGHWIIASRLGRVDVGVYAVAAKFASVVVLVVSVLQAAWLPYGLESLASQNGRVFFSQILLAYTACVSLSVTALGFAAPSLIRLLIPAEYARAGTIVGLALVAPLFFGFYSLFSIPALLRAGRTWWLTIMPTCCAVLNLLLSLSLVRLWGMQGVILGTGISAVALALLTLRLSLKIAPIPLSLRGVGAMAVLTLATAVSFAVPSVDAGSGRYVVVLINVIAAAACLAAMRNRANGESDVPTA